MFRRRFLTNFYIVSSMSSNKDVSNLNPRSSSPLNQSVKSSIHQFYCNLCFVPLVTGTNSHRPSFITSCGHFYCELCAQTIFQGSPTNCKICQSSLSNLTCFDLRKKLNDEIDMMISSTQRTRKWFDDQVRQRPFEQILLNLDQRNSFLTKQIELCSKTVLRQAESVQHQVPYEKMMNVTNRIVQETKQSSELLYKLLSGLSQSKIRLTVQQQQFCQNAVDRCKMYHK